MDNRLDLSQISLGQPITPWHLEAIDQEIIPIIEDYLGKPLLILFFSFGCPGCLGRAIPFANSIVVEHSEKINVIGIHTNFEGVDFEKSYFMEMKEKFYIRFPFFKDKNFDTSFLNYGAGGTPHWILVDEHGIVNYSIFGSDPNNALLRLTYKMAELFADKA